MARASKKSPGMDERALFIKSSEEFAVIVRRLQKISYDLHGNPVDTPQYWGSTLLYRLCVNGDTLISMWDDDAKLDHFSIAVQARSMIETGIMILYVTHPGLTDEEWKLRRDVLYLHDCITRLRLWKALGKKREADKGRKIATDLRKRIVGNPLYQGFEKTEQSNMLSGKVLYIGGLSSAVRSAGFSNDWFEAIHVTLAAYTHATPFSYWDAIERELWKGNSPYAYHSAGFSLHFLSQMMKAVEGRFKKSTAKKGKRDRSKKAKDENAGLPLRFDETFAQDIFYRARKTSVAIERTTDQNLKEELAQVSGALSAVNLSQKFAHAQIATATTPSETTIAEAKYLLACRFCNAIYATLRLTLMGMPLEANTMLRSALEILQYHRLIRLKPLEAELYLDYEKSLTPVEVLKRLQEFGEDTAKNKDRHSKIKKLAQIGGVGEVFTLEPDSDAYRVGGYVETDFQRAMIVSAKDLCGDFIVFGSGIRPENVERFHSEVLELFEKYPIQEAFEKIEKLVESLK